MFGVAQTCHARPTLAALRHRVNVSMQQSRCPIKQASDKLSRSATLAAKGGTLLHKRLQLAQDKFAERTRAAVQASQPKPADLPMTPWDLWQSWFDYGLDFTQR